MDIINLKKIIYDTSLIMAIIAINMTIIGLTSLADFKKVVGVDYGTFLIKKYKVVRRITIYKVLILFAVINVSSLFLMFIDNYLFRMLNFLFLILSLMFAIYYFFNFIIIDNKSVRRQIYEMELEGIYIDSDNTEHHQADVLTGMHSGSSSPKRISSNLVEYFNTYNDETLSTFKEVFGPSSLLYDQGKKRLKRYRKLYDARPYVYRKEKSNNIADISFEFLQFLRTNQLADKWSLEILRLMDGQLPDRYEQLRLFNFTRLVAQINLFISTGGIYQYKFLQHLKPYYYNVVEFRGEERLKSNVVEVEKYTFSQLLHLFYNENNCKDALFYEFAEAWLVEMVYTSSYKGLLSRAELVEIMLEKVHTYDTPEYKKAFTEVLSAFYATTIDIPDTLTLTAVKQTINKKPIQVAPYKKINQAVLFTKKEQEAASV